MTQFSRENMEAAFKVLRDQPLVQPRPAMYMVHPDQLKAHHATASYFGERFKDGGYPGLYLCSMQVKYYYRKLREYGKR